MNKRIKNKNRPGGMPEPIRKFLVALKRQPFMIPLTVLIIAFLQYSLNLTHISDTTAKIQGTGMGLCGFCTMLFSMLSLMCFLNAFPRRKKPVISMICLMIIMFGIVFYCDYHYATLIRTALNRADNPVVLDSSTIYIAQAWNVLQDHMALLIAGFVITALLPVYSFLLRKIDTSIQVEDYGKLGEIDVSGED